MISSHPLSPGNCESRCWVESTPRVQAEVPMVVPSRAWVDEVKTLKQGDIYVGRGSKQRGLLPSLWGNRYKVSKFGRDRTHTQHTHTPQHTHAHTTPHAHTNHTQHHMHTDRDTDTPTRHNHTQHHIHTQHHMHTPARHRHSTTPHAHTTHTKQHTPQHIFI